MPPPLPQNRSLFQAGRPQRSPPGYRRRDNGGRGASRARAPSPHSLLLLLPLPPPRPGRRPPPWPAPAPVLVPASPRGSPGSVHRQRGGEGMEKEKGKGTRVKPGGDYKSRQAALPPRLSLPLPCRPRGKRKRRCGGQRPQGGFWGQRGGAEPPGAMPSPPGWCRGPTGASPPGEAGTGALPGLGRGLGIKGGLENGNPRC